MLNSYSSEGEDVVMLRLITALGLVPPGETGFYVDIGAFHPVLYSNTYLFYRAGWRGVNVEPNPQFIGEFAQYRPEDVTVNAGVSAHSSVLAYRRFDDPQVNGFFTDEGVAEVPKHGYSYIDTLKIECIGTEDFLRSYVDRPIDVLSIDTEGHEMAVLGSWDWVEKRPKVICVEIHGSTLPDILAAPVCRLLCECGYAPMSRVFQSAMFVDAARLPHSGKAGDSRQLLTP